MVEDLEAERHASDGGGEVTLVSGPTEIGAGEPGTWTFEYRAGPQGIADGGALVFQVPAFWGWEPPQLQSPDGPGFVDVHTDAEGVRLQARVLDQSMVWIAIGGRALGPGEGVRLTYGAGVGARADRYAERESAFWFAVDGDGDGVRRLVDSPVRIDVGAGPGARLVVSVPSVVEPGDLVQVRVAVLDARGNADVDWSEPVELVASAPIQLPQRLVLDERGIGRIDAEATQAGVLVIEARSGGLVGVSNPVLIRRNAEPILWGDLQIHTGRSDGTGTPRDVLTYARDVAGLDVASVTDHDHWGMRFLDATPELWAESVSVADELDDPGRFVAIPGYEWTSWLHGHRHVLWFEPEPDLYSSMDPKTGDPGKLWAALDGHRVLTVAHHSAGGPVATDWSFSPPPGLEPVTEVVSVHGQSESSATPGAIYDAVDGNFVVDQLRKGLKVGMIGSTDGHDGHPGLGQLNAPSSGLAGILATERTREAVYEALRARRTYATNGVRAILRFEVGGKPMGSVLPAEGPVEAMVRVVGTAPISRIEAVYKDGTTQLVGATGGPLAHKAWTLEAPQAGDFLYVRVVQEDGGMAWSSPVFFEGE